MAKPIDDELLLDLIDRIYAAGLGEIEWSGVTDPLRDALGCSVVSIHADDPGGDEAVVVAHSGLSVAQMARYEEYYHTTNLWLSRSAPFLESGMLLHGEEVVDQGELRKSEYYADYLEENGMEWALSACLFHEPRLIALLSLFRPRGSDGFAANDVEALRVLMPHLQRAVSSSRRLRHLESQVGLARKSLDAFGRGALVLDWKGQVVVWNARMEEILVEDDGVFLSRDRVHFHDGSAQEALDEILSEAPMDGGRGGFSASRPSFRRAYEVRIVRLPPGERDGPAFSALHDRAGWLLVVSDPEAPLVAAEPTVQQVFGLTKSEAQIAVQLAAGRTVPEIARSRGRSTNTVKSQVRLIYRKLAVTSRAELVRRVGIYLKPGGD